MEQPSASEIFQNIWGMIQGFVSSAFPTLSGMIETVLELVLSVRDIFSDGIRWILGQIMDWLGGMIEQGINTLMSSLTSALGGIGSFLSYVGSFPVGLSDFSLFELTISLELKPGFGFDTDAFTDFVYDLIFKGGKGIADLSFSTILSGPCRYTGGRPERHIR